MAKKNSPENILETLATELAKHTPGTQEYEKIFKQYYDLTQLLETKRTNVQKEALEYSKIKIDQQRADQEANKIKIDHEDRISERDYQKELEELKQKHAIELADINKSAEKLKAMYALWSSIGGAAIGAAATITVVGLANSSARKRTRDVLYYEETGTIASQGGKQTISNTLKPTKN